MENVAGIYELYWNSDKQDLLERPKLVLQVEGTTLFSYCSWNVKLTTMFRIGHVPTAASTAPVDCHLAYPTNVSGGNEWDFGDPGVVHEGEQAITANMGDMRFLSNRLVLMDHSVAGVTPAAAFPAVIFADKATEDAQSDAKIKHLWNLKHGRCCGCGHKHESEADEAHGWGEKPEPKQLQWDEKLVDQAVARLTEDPLQEFQGVDRLFLGADMPGGKSIDARVWNSCS